jgi:hypothetical protein
MLLSGHAIRRTLVEVMGTGALRLGARPAT